MHQFFYQLPAVNKYIPYSNRATEACATLLAMHRRGHKKVFFGLLCMFASLKPEQKQKMRNQSYKRVITYK